MSTNTRAEASSSSAAVAFAAASPAADDQIESSDDGIPCAAHSAPSSSSTSPPPPPPQGRRRGRWRRRVPRPRQLQAYRRRPANDVYESRAKYDSRTSAMGLFDPQLAQAFYRAAHRYHYRPGVDYNMCLGTEEAIWRVARGFMRLYGAEFFPNEESEARVWQTGLTLDNDWEAEKVSEGVHEYFRYMQFLRYEIRDRRIPDSRWGWDWEKRRSV